MTPRTMSQAAIEAGFKDLSAQWSTAYLENDPTIGGASAAMHRRSHEALSRRPA